MPSIPTIGTATAGNASASITFTPGGITGTSYTVLSTPGSFTGTGVSSPITVSGLSNGTAYTFQVKATNAVGDSLYSSASNSVTPVAPVSVVTGGTLTSDATYYYRTFTGNGTLGVSNNPLTCDVLIGAGGGSGGGIGSGSASGGGSFTSGYVAAVGSYNFVIGAIQNNSTGIGITAYAGGAGSVEGNGNSGGSGSGGGTGTFSGGAATKASGGTITYGNTGGNSVVASGGKSGSGGGGGWGSSGGSNYSVGPVGDKFGFGGPAGSGTTDYNSWSQATGIGQLSGGIYYIGAGAAGNSESVGPAALGLGANSSGYDGSGFVMVRYLKTAV